MPYNPATPTRDIAEWIVARHHGAKTSARARVLAEVSIIDTLACMFSAQMESAPKLLKTTVPSGASLPASLIGLGSAASAFDAALINGTSAHMLDYDDGDMVSRGHPSTVILPTLFALAEERGASGADVTEAFIVGWAVMQTLGAIVNPYMPARGYHVTTVIGVVAAAAAAAHLLRLDVGQTATAMGIAASDGAGLRGNFGTDMKAYHAGCAAAAAVRAAQLAKLGFTASQSIVETIDGFASTLADKAAVEKVRGTVDRLLAGDISLEKEPPLIKFMPICHSTHSPVEAALKIRPRLAGGVGAIESILAEAGSHTKQYLIHHRPTTGLEAKFSMEGALAIALIDGKAGMAQFTNDSVLRPEVQALLRKVTYKTDTRYDDPRYARQQPGAVTIVTKAGTFQEEVLDPLGSRTFPATVDMVCAKFADCAAGALGDAEVSAATRLMKEFGTLANLRQLGTILRGKAA